MNVRTSKPNSSNKFYITTSRGGYSQCVTGKPTDRECNVLSNCVGYACGRFNELIGEMKYPTLYCNAENFIERAKSLGLEISNVPTLGGIMVWQKGSTLNGSDGAGHVGIVERIDNQNQIYTSESAYGGKAFYNVLRTNSNGRWGIGSAYKFRGCIINPAIGAVKYEEKSSGYSHEQFVREVQSAIGAKVDGIAGPETLGKTITISRKQNKNHAVVKSVQKYLMHLGYSLSRYGSDGDFGRETEVAVKAYQKDNGCVVDGIITAKNKTWKKLLKFA